MLKNKCITRLVITALLALPLAPAYGDVGETPTTGTTQDDSASILKEIQALKTKYDQTKDAKEKDSITNKIDELTKKLESLNRATPLLPEISTDLSPQIKAQNITATISNKFTILTVNVPDAKSWTWSVIWDGMVQRNVITSFPYKTSTKWTANKEIQLYATNSLGHWGYSALFTPSQGTDEKTPPTGTTQDEATSIKKEIEALKAKYDQTKDAKEKDSITNKIDELTKKLEILEGEDEVKGQIVSLINSIDKEEQSVISINASIKKQQAEYKATKTTKGKKAINANIIKLKKQKDIITKKITELTIMLKQAKTKIILNEQSD